jgi:hypothetical protein
MNAKQEFLDIIEDIEVLCAVIDVKGDQFDKPYLQNYTMPVVKSKHLILPINFSKEEYENFLNELNFKYDNSWGHWYMNGTIWLKNGRWIERLEYDGSEWWKLVQAPNIPKECFPKEDKVDYNKNNNI